MRYVADVSATTMAEESFVKNGRREVMIASSRSPQRYSLYSTVLMSEIIMMR